MKTITSDQIRTFFIIFVKSVLLSLHAIFDLMNQRMKGHHNIQSDRPVSRGPRKKNHSDYYV
jgi:hypothetical protein